MKTMNAKKIGKRLVALRGDKTQSKVANDIGISVSALAMYESGTRIPRDNIKIRLAEYYSKPITTIFFD